MKKLVSLLLVLVFSFSLTVTAYAADDAQDAAPDVSTMDFTYITYTTCSFNITSYGLAQCSDSMLCSSSIDRIQFSVYLQKYDGGWVTVKHWTQNTYSNYATFGESYYVMSGYTYRHRCYYYAYINGSIVESTSSVTYDSY